MLRSIKIFQFLAFSLAMLLPSAAGNALPAGVTKLADIPYGAHAKQKLDVYKPSDAQDAPVIFMIHGGGWLGGDKARPAEVDNKVARWVTRGFVLISTNYRTLPEMVPIGQAKDVAAAIAFAQANARDWGGAPDKFILMGHSAGAHLVSYVSSNADALVEPALMPWLGTVSLDPPYDMLRIMTRPNPSDHYLRVFGTTPDQWRDASPYHVLTGKIPAFLAVCSVQSATACPQATHFLEKAESLGTEGTMLPVDLTHREINSVLGTASCYTDKVEGFLATLSPEIAAMLSDNGAGETMDCHTD